MNNKRRWNPPWEATMSSLTPREARFSFLGSHDSRSKKESIHWHRSQSPVKYGRVAVQSPNPLPTTCAIFLCDRMRPLRLEMSGKNHHKFSVRVHENLQKNGDHHDHLSIATRWANQYDASRWIPRDARAWFESSKSYSRFFDIV